MDHSLVCRTFTYMFYKTIWQMSHKRPSWLECLCMGFECFPWVLLLELDVVFLCNCLYLSFSSVINWGTVNFAMTKSQVVWVPVPPPYRWCFYIQKVGFIYFHPPERFYFLHVKICIKFTRQMETHLQCHSYSQCCVCGGGWVFGM